MGNTFLGSPPSARTEISQLAMPAGHLYLSQACRELRGCDVVTKVLSQPILPQAV